MDRIKDKPLIILGACSVTSAFLIVLGIGLLSTSSYPNTVAFNYINATYCDYDYQNLTCRQVRALKPTAQCSCYQQFEINEDLPGPVSAFYELPTFNYEKMAGSRDDAQLSGNLLHPPSDACGNYSYDSGKPIAPCGEMADAYAGCDTYSVLPINSSIEQYTFIPGVLTESEKSPYHNPPGDLIVAFQNYTKPKSWPADFWTKFLNDSAGVNNSAFQNERFIGYLTTSMNRKPYGIFADGGKAVSLVQKGNYSLQISFKNYNYLGDRMFILSSPVPLYNYSKYNAGIVLLIIGLLAATGTVFLCYVHYKRQVGKSNQAEISETQRMRI